MRKLYLFVTDTLSDWEPANVLAELHSGRYLKDPALKYNIVLCGRTMDAITTMGGIRMVPDVLIRDIRPDKDDVLILPGSDTWLDPVQEPAIAKVRELLDQNRTVAAICGATMALANAGLLDNRPHTSNDVAVLKMFCPHYHGERYYFNEPAVTDRNLITASGLAPVEFAYQIFKRLDVMSPATVEAWHGLYTSRRPEFFYALMESISTSNKNSA